MDFVRPVEAIVPGAQGRVLGVMAETTAELNLRTIAELSGVSQAQASRVLPGLVELGVLQRREVPPSSLFRFVPEHIASRAILVLARSVETVLDELGHLASSLLVPPMSVVVFGSFARREADAESDIDVLVVRPAEVDEDDETWASSMEQLHTHGRRLTGNPLEVLEVSAGEIATLLRSRRPLWSDIRRDGRVVHGLPLDQLRRVAACLDRRAREPCRRPRCAPTQRRPRSSPRRPPATSRLDATSRPPASPSTPTSTRPTRSAGPASANTLRATTTTTFWCCSDKLAQTVPRWNVSSAACSHSRARPSTTPMTSRRRSPPRRSSEPSAALRCARQESRYVGQVTGGPPMPSAANSDRSCQVIERSVVLGCLRLALRLRQLG